MADSLLDRMMVSLTKSRHNSIRSRWFKNVGYASQIMRLLNLQTSFPSLHESLK